MIDKDGLDLQCVSAVIFIYFASLSGAIAFGGLMGTKTNDDVGIPETLLGRGNRSLLILWPLLPGFDYHGHCCQVLIIWPLLPGFDNLATAARF